MKKITSILALLFLCSCKMMDAVDSVNATPEKMDSMNSKMSSMQQEMANTNESIRLQKVAIAKENLENPQNAEVLLPVPVGLMGYALLFAENATLEEIAGQIYLYLKEVNDGVYMNPVDDTGSMIDFSAQESAQINQSKLHKFTAAQAICGLLPQATVEQLVREYIYGENRYQKTAYNILMMRYQFLRDVMLNGSLLSESIEDVGSLEKAHEYISYMSWIAQRPFIDKVQVKIYGFLPPQEEFAEELSLALASESLLALYETTLSRAANIETVQVQSFTGNSDEDNRLHTERNQRLQSVLSAIESDMAFWKNQNP